MSAPDIRRTVAATGERRRVCRMKAWGLVPSKLPRYREMPDEYGSVANYPASWRPDPVLMSLETLHRRWVAQVLIKPKGISKKMRAIGAPEFRHIAEARVASSISFH